MDVNDSISRLADEFCCDETLVRQVSTLATSPIPAFVYIYDAHTPGNTRSMIERLLDQSPSTADGLNVAHVLVNCVACFSQRILFDTTLNALMKHRPDWSNGFNVWRDGTLESGNWNDSLDGFLHGLSACYAALSRGGADETGSSIAAKIVLVFEKPEKLKDVHPALIMPLARLHELVNANITTIFLSETEWESVTPHAGTIPDPYRITVQTPSKEAIIKIITKKFPVDQPVTSLSPYNPVLKPIFLHFVETVYSVCSPFTVDPKELAYFVAARWPGYVLPVIEDWKHQSLEELQAPSEQSRIKLTRLFIPSLSNAVETLYPRVLSAKEWSEINAPPSGFRLSQSMAKLPPQSTPGAFTADEFPELPKLSIFILVASFLASHNPAKTDARMFGRGADDKKRKKKKGGSPRKQGSSAKVPQLLQGPMTFPYERLVAILGSLLLEYDEGVRPSASFVGAVIKVESNVHRTHTNALIQDLVSKHLLHRTTPPERIDGAQFKCGLNHEQALVLARRLDIPLAELMWDPI